ncbi:hypothetical protein GCM10010236_07640 [Streptomyces eurythermus]|nr:hypothetical protein GCM10010236_07640 [Streptomyces eurythermus]
MSPGAAGRRESLAALVVIAGAVVASAEFVWWSGAAPRRIPRIRARRRLPLLLRRRHTLDGRPVAAVCLRACEPQLDVALLDTAASASPTALLLRRRDFGKVLYPCGPGLPGRPGPG